MAYTVPSTPVTGALDSYDLPNYVGELFDLMPQVTPVFSAIGGLNGGYTVESRDFPWEVEDGEAASATAQVLENATPTGSAVPRQWDSNVVEIHQEAVEVGYTAQAVTGQLGPLAPNSTTGVVLGNQPVMDVMQHQINKKIGKIKRDLNMSVINGTYNAPTTNGTARRTRGLLQAITTHTINFTTGAGGKGTLYTSYKDVINDMLVKMAAPTNEADTAPMINLVIVVNPSARVTISDEYSASGALAPRDRTIGGVAISTIVTDFGTIGLMSDRYLPATSMMFLDFSVLKMAFLPIPGKGVFFAEPLAKSGATDKVQLYGEIGLNYGPESFHGQVTTIA